MAKNMVIAGNYAGKLVRVSVGPMGVPSISLNIFKDEYVERCLEHRDFSAEQRQQRTKQHIR